MSRQPSFASPNPLLTLPLCGPGHGNARKFSNADPENQHPNRQTVAGGTPREWSDSPASSMSLSSGIKRRFEDALEDAKAGMEARLRKEFEHRYAERLRDEVEMRKAAEKKAQTAEMKAEVALDKFNARSRELRMWRVRTVRAQSARNSPKNTHFIRENDGTLLRTEPVRAEVGGKPERRAIKTQLVEESGALQPRRGGVGGTEFTTRERLLSFREDEKLGLGSRRDRSKKSDEARTLRQRNVSVAWFPGKKKGRSAAEVVDVFVTPNEKAAKEARFAMSMLAYCKWGRKASDAVAINISPDAKTYGPLRAFSHFGDQCGLQEYFSRS